MNFIPNFHLQVLVALLSVCADASVDGTSSSLDHFDIAADGDGEDLTEQLPEKSEECAASMNLIQSALRHVNNRASFDSRKISVRATTRPHTSAIFHERHSDDGSWRTKILPEVLLIGLNHAGTTTLSELMNLHPNLSYGSKKEHRFFTDKAGFCYGVENLPWNREWLKQNRSVANYLDEFEVPSTVQMTFDASPFTWALGCPHWDKSRTFQQKLGTQAVEAVRHILGSDVKIIFVLKDPLLWLSSMMGTCVTDLKDEYALDTIFCMPQALQNWVEVFGKKQVLFLDSANIFTNLSATADKINEFIGLPRRTYMVDRELSAGRRRSAYMLPTSYAKALHPRCKECQRQMEMISGLSLDWSCHGEA